MARVLIGVSAFEHLAFLVLEMFLWNTPFGRRTFHLSVEEATVSAPLAKNQGLYNGFLAAGLAWSLFASPELARPLAIFFLACVAVAGVVGTVTTGKRTIVFVQGLPAAAALALLLA
jgi:putative membrane protein